MVGLQGRRGGLRCAGNPLQNDKPRASCVGSNFTGSGRVSIGASEDSWMFQVGDVIDGQYRLVRRIGEGGHGAVFEAEDLDIGAPVALKFLRSEIADAPEFATRMRRE